MAMTQGGLPARPPGTPAIPAEQRSALSDFLANHAQVYETVGAVIPRDLMQFGLLGTSVMVLTCTFAFILPSGSSVGHSSFYLVLGHAQGGIVSLMHAVALPLFLCGLALLALDFYLLQVPTGERWRAAVVIQAGLGGFGATIATLFFALVLLNLAIWIAIIGAIAAGICLLLMALAGG